MAKKKSSNLSDILAEVNSIYGENSANRVKDYGDVKVETFSSRSPKLDRDIGGGYPRGRIIEWHGANGSGKTTLALHAIAEIQSLGEKAVLFDFEQSFDPEYATSLGVDVDSLILSQPAYGEMGFDIAERLIKSGEVSLIIFDSAAAMKAKREIDGEYGDSNVGIQAKMFSNALPKLNSLVGEYNCTVGFINQIRFKVGVMYGSPETVPCGEALKFYTSQRFRISAHKKIEENGEFVAIETRVEAKKNRISSPFTKTETTIRFGKGIWIEKEIIEIGVENGVVDKKGSHYYYGEVKLGNGMKNVMATLDDNPDLLEEIKEKCLTKK